MQTLYIGSQQFLGIYCVATSRGHKKQSSIETSESREHR